MHVHMQIRACNTEKCMEIYILHSAAAVCSCGKDKVLFCHTKTAAARKIMSQIFMLWWWLALCFIVNESR